MIQIKSLCPFLLAIMVLTTPGFNAIWEDITFNLPTDLQVVGSVPGKNKLVALGGNGQKNGNKGTAWSLTLGGTSWTKLGTGAGTEEFYLHPFGILFDPKNSDIFWTWGNYDLKDIGGLFVTKDGGATFQHNPPQACGQTWCEAEWFSVDFKDPERKTWLIGEHETPKSVRKSVDGGKTWTQIGTTLPTGSGRSHYVLVIDANTFLIGCSFTVSYGTDNIGGTPGIYRTANGGNTWTKVSDEKLFQSALMIGDTIYWTFFNGTDGGLLKSTDKGLTWIKSPDKGMDYTAEPLLLPDGSLTMLNSSKSLVRSTDGAKTWIPFSPAIQAINLNDPHSMVYNASAQAFILWQKSGKVLKYDFPIATSAMGPLRDLEYRVEQNSAETLPDKAFLYKANGARSSVSYRLLGLKFLRF